MSIDLMPGFGAFTQSSGATLPTFPAPSAVGSQASPYWADGHSALDRTSSVADPAGGSLAERYTFNLSSTVGNSGGSLGGAAAARPFAVTYNSGTTYTVSVIARSLAASTRYLRLNHFSGSDSGCRFDLSAGTVLSYRTGGITESGSGITNLGDGWFQCWYTFAAASTGDWNHECGCGATDSGGDFDATFSCVSGHAFELFRYQVVTGTDPNG
jgi:hypothetical protein